MNRNTQKKEWKKQSCSVGEALFWKVLNDDNNVQITKQNKEEKRKKGFYVFRLSHCLWRCYPICLPSFASLSLSPPLLVFLCFGKWGHRGAVFLRLLCETAWTRAKWRKRKSNRGMKGGKREKESQRDHFYPHPPPSPLPRRHYSRSASQRLEY